MTIEKTKNIKPEETTVMIIYGKGGVGKTSFGASAPEPLLLDFENGGKYLGQRGFDIDIVRFSKWITTAEKKELAKVLNNYKTIIVDPIGEAMDKLIESEEIQGKKYRQNDGSLSMSGWGEVKRQMKGFVKWLRDSGKNVILISHLNEIQDDTGLNHRIQIATGLSDDLPNMVEIVSYCGVKKAEDGTMKRVLYTPASGGLFDSKDRTGTVPKTVEISEKYGWGDFMASRNFPTQEEKPQSTTVPAINPEPESAPAPAVNPKPELFDCKDDDPFLSEKKELTTIESIDSQIDEYLLSPVFKDEERKKYKIRREKYCNNKDDLMSLCVDLELEFKARVGEKC